MQAGPKPYFLFGATENKVEREGWPTALTCPADFGHCRSTLSPGAQLRVVSGWHSPRGAATALPSKALGWPSGSAFLQSPGQVGPTVSSDISGILYR